MQIVFNADGGDGEENVATQPAIEAMAPASTMPRPKQSDDLIVRAAAEKLAVDCVEWAGEGEASDWVEDLIKCRHYWNDGYELAKELESRCYISPDAELVETLGSAYSYLSQEQRDAVKKWVQIVGFDPKFAVGDVVTCRHGTGPVQKVYLESAEYVVATDDRKWSGDGSGYVIPAEDVRQPA